MFFEALVHSPWTCLPLMEAQNECRHHGFKQRSPSKLVINSQDGKEVRDRVMTTAGEGQNQEWEDIQREQRDDIKSHRGLAHFTIPLLNTAIYLISAKVCVWVCVGIGERGEPEIWCDQRPVMKGQSVVALLCGGWKDERNKPWERKLFRWVND